MYETILVPTDGSDGSIAAAEEAITLATPGETTLHALYVVDVRMSPLTEHTDHDDLVALFEESDADPTGPVLRRATDADVPAVEAIRVGVPHEVITEYAADHDADLVVMGTHGRTGLERGLLGSVTERVVRLADVPVLTVQPD